MGPFTCLRPFLKHPLQFPSEGTFQESLWIRDRSAWLCPFICVPFPRCVTEKQGPTPLCTEHEHSGRPTINSTSQKLFGIPGGKPFFLFGKKDQCAPTKVCLCVFDSTPYPHGVMDMSSSF